MLKIRLRAKAELSLTFVQESLTACLLTEIKKLRYYGKLSLIYPYQLHADKKSDK